jgi:spore coat polysaccharide biosynthesis protein SpsF
MTNTGVFLQVRLSSSRLPRKALLPLKGTKVIEHAMAGLSRVNAEVYALLTDEESGAELKPIAKRWGFEVFVGPADDVLLRYAQAVGYYGVERYMRATGDNPLVSWELAESLAVLHDEFGADFSGYLGPPLGTGIELTEAAAILAADAESTDPYEREHVSPFIYHRPERFRVLRPWAPSDVSLPEAKVTLDTVADYEYLSTIYDALYDGEPISVEALVRWLRNVNQDGVHETAKPNNTPCAVGNTR